MVPFPNIPCRPSEWASNFENTLADPLNGHQISKTTLTDPLNGRLILKATLTDPLNGRLISKTSLTDPLNGQLFRKIPLQTARRQVFHENHSGFSAPLHPHTACNKKQAAGKRVPQQPAFI